MKFELFPFLGKDLTKFKDLLKLNTSGLVSGMVEWVKMSYDPKERV